MAVRLNPTSSAIRTEQAYVQFQRDDITASLQSYSEASQLDEGNTAAINGMIRCKIARGQFDDAAHELDFLSEIQVGGLELRLVPDSTNSIAEGQ